MKCTKGKYIRNEYICCLCGNGTISTEDNSDKCIDCPQRYGPNEDHTECIKCPYGTYSPAEGSGCLDCGIGKYDVKRK